MKQDMISQDRRALLQVAAAAGVGGLFGGAGAAAQEATAAGPSHMGAPRHDAVLFPPAPLAQQPYQLLPVGAIKPTGWLRRQLEIQAAGLGGRLDETWPDVGPDSGWLGGKGESWERGPYFIDGLLPLAWQLEDPALKAKAQRFIDWTLEHPWENGMFGPRQNDDWWPRMVMLKVLTQYHELTGDARVIPFMTRYFHHQLQAMPARPLRDWGRMRWADEVISVVWLYTRTQDPKLLQLATLLKQQGYDWQARFADFPFKEKVDAKVLQAGVGDAVFMQDRGQEVHGVNHAQGIKASPMWYLLSKQETDRKAIHHQLAMLDRYHGMPNGMYAADEHLAGLSPSQGVELCAVVEVMYSLELALAVTGDAPLGDRLERIAFNALPATFTDDMWGHQYDQQPNQVECSLHRKPWTTNGPEANLYGLEPNFGCCTANFHQGWPKLTGSLWMASRDEGLAAMVYAPCRIATQVRGTPVEIEQTTEYPFRQNVRITVRPQQALEFPIHLRIPGWSRATVLRVNGQAQKVGAGFTQLLRRWSPGDVIELEFDAQVVVERGHHDAVTYTRGALVYSLPVGEAWVPWRKRGLTTDWMVYPTTRWNYGIVDAPASVQEHPVGPVPFAGKNPAVTLQVQGRPVPAWKAEEGAADPVPEKPQAASDEPAVALTLIPYGAAKLRITAFARVPAQARETRA
jgi:hypothetical protein